MSEKKTLSVLELVRADVERRLGHEMSPDGLRALEEACKITCGALAEGADPHELGELSLRAVTRGADFEEVQGVLSLGATAAERGDDPDENLARTLSRLDSLAPQEACL